MKDMTRFKLQRNNNINNFSNLNKRNYSHISPSPSTLRKWRVEDLYRENSRKLHELIFGIPILKRNNQNKYYSSTTKEKSKKIWVDFNTFNYDDFEGFKNELYYSGKLVPGVKYSILIKLR